MKIYFVILQSALEVFFNSFLISRLCIHLILTSFVVRGYNWMQLDYIMDKWIFSNILLMILLISLTEPSAGLKWNEKYKKLTSIFNLDLAKQERKPAIFLLFFPQFHQSMNINSALCFVHFICPLLFKRCSLPFACSLCNFHFGNQIEDERIEVFNLVVLLNIHLGRWQRRQGKGMIWLNSQTMNGI